MKPERLSLAMLSERTLIAASLAVSLAGLASLILILLSCEIPAGDLAVVDAGHAREEARVRVRAQIAQVRVVRNVTLLTLREEVRRNAVIFDPVNVSVGQLVEIEGDVQDRNGTPELVVRRLEVVG